MINYKEYAKTDYQNLKKLIKCNDCVEAE